MPASSQFSNGASRLNHHPVSELKLDSVKDQKTTPFEQTTFFPSGSNLLTTVYENQGHELWAEVKTKDKSIQKRCYHISFIYNERFYVHGGYEMNSGRLSDFYSIDINDDFTLGKWQKIEANGEIKPKGLCRHSGVVWENTLYIFGGQNTSTGNTNELWSFDLHTNTWKKIEYPSKPKIPSLDSHTGLLYVDAEGVPYIIVSCGFIGDDLGEYTNQTMSYNIPSNKWDILFPHTPVTKKNSSRFPIPRAGQAGAIVDGLLYIFGGTNSDNKFNDMWTFNLQKRTWTENVCSNSGLPDARNGHTLVQYDKDNLALFGGFQDIAHERDDLMLFNRAKTEWQVIEQESMQGKVIRRITTVESQNRSPEKRKVNIAGNRNSSNSRSPQRSPPRLKINKTIGVIQTDRQSVVSINQSHYGDANRSMTTVDEETRQKHTKKKGNSDINKMILLQNFEVNDDKLKKKLAIASPTTEAMRSSIEAIVSKRAQHHQTSVLDKDKEKEKEKDKDKDLGATKGSTNWDPHLFENLNIGQAVTEGKVWGKRPSARDGHTAHIYKGTLLIFGGDRHKMSFNDFHIYTLERALDSLKMTIEH